MICEQCQKEGKKSTITRPSGGFTTLMYSPPGYWDEGGKYHQSPNLNTTTYSYTCSNGHSWSVTE